MVSISTLHHKPRLHDFYRSLRARGKEAKVAIVAVIRKMLMTLSTAVRGAESGPILKPARADILRLPAIGRHYYACLPESPKPLRRHGCSMLRFPCGNPSVLILAKRGTRLPASTCASQRPLQHIQRQASECNSMFQPVVEMKLNTPMCRHAQTKDAVTTE